MPQKNNHESFESFKVKGEDLLKEIKKLIHEGNIRKIIIKDEKGKKVFIEIPVTIGVIGTILAPILAAVGAFAAIVGLVTVEVQKNEKSAPAKNKAKADKSATKQETKKTTTKKAPSKKITTGKKTDNTKKKSKK